MKSMPHIPSSNEEKPQLVPVYNQGEFFMEPKEINQGIALEKISTTAEIPKEVNKLQEKCKGIEINKLEVLPSMKDNQHHGTIILRDFEDPFLRKKSAKDDSFKFFEFIHLLSARECNMFCKIC